MKLELKHLAGYLPYGLKLKKTNQTVLLRGINDNAAVGGVELTYWINPKLSHLDIWRNGEVRNFVLYYSGFSQFKPILRPLSDLTKDIGGFIFEDWVNESSCPAEFDQYHRCIN